METEIRENESLRGYSLFGMPSSVKFLALPKSLEELKETISYCTSNNISYKIIGNGSNLLFAKEKYEGCFIVTKKMQNYQISDTQMSAEAGVPLLRLALAMAEKEFSGLESLYGIPGTVGGAAYTNAGSFGAEFYDFVKSIDVITDKPHIENIMREQIPISYRRGYHENPIAQVHFDVNKFKKLSKEQIKKNIEHYQYLRGKSQPKGKSAGCIFKNPGNEIAGRIIQDLGWQGKAIGDAQVSPLHANYIINNGNAKPSEIKELIKNIQDDVKKRRDIDLELEIEILESL